LEKPGVAHQRILILDFGSQVTQLIARRVREAQVYCEIHRPDNGLYEHPDFTWPELEASAREAYRTFYGRPSYVFRQLRRSAERGQLLREARYTLALGATGLMSAFARR
jgi:hypothetical protein